MSILGGRVLGGAGQQPYLVGRSLRFRSSASAYLNRTNASNGNLNTWTISFWIKRGALTTGSNQCVIGTSYTSLSEIVIRFNADDTFRFEQYASGGITNLGTLVTSQVFRDPSAWYHFVIIFDSSNATASNRVRLYVNGTQVTAFSSATYPAQNANSIWNNNANTQFIGKYSTAQHFDGYIAEVNFIDGQALTPSSFGAYDNNGIWQPIKYGGTYGTNGFYLPFSNTTSTTTLVQDASGNGNNWTPNNISLTAGTTYDSMIDSPTVSNASSNYCTLNSAANQSGITLSNANLAYNLTNGTNGALGTFPMYSGKWYWEVTIGSSNGNWNVVGICNTSLGVQPPVQYYTTSAGRGYFGNTGNKVGAGTNASYGATFTAGDLIGVAFDADAGSLTFYKNNVSQGVAFSGLATGVAWVPLQDSSIAASTTGTVNYGQQPFTYTPPTGFNALNTYNLPQPTIMNGAKYMQATLYTGNGSATQTIAQSVTGNSATFLPDFVWTKGRSGATNNIQIDTVRGGANYLISDSTSAEAYNAAAAIQSFSSNGYVIGNGGAVNTNAATYVSWQWNAGSGTTSTNTNGSISSLVSVNPSAGFSIVSYTGTSGTVGHGLNAAPDMFIVKNRSGSADSWYVYHSALGNTKYLTLDQTAAAVTNANWWGTINSSIFTLGSVWTLSKAYIAYCWSAVAGYSAFGSYTGNASTDGPFVYLGFRPRYLLMKSAATANEWYIWDTARNTYNTVTQILTANSSAAESTATAGQPQLDILSNGFKVRDSGNAINSTSMVYAAFAENPFKISRAR